MAKAKSKKITLEEALVPVEEQPYEVPENWCWVKLSYIADIRTGRKDANYGNEDGEYYFFTCASEPIRCDDYSYDCKAILLAGNGDIGNISIYEGKFEAYQRTYIVETKENIITEYLYYYFKYRWVDYNNDKMFGTAIPYIRLGNLNEFEIPVPPLSEQQRIVEQIESLFAKLDEAKEKALSVVESFESRKKAILNNAFNGLYSTDWREKHHCTLADWKDRKINEICIPRAGFAFNSKKFTESGIQIIRMGNLYAGKLNLSRSPVFYDISDVDDNIIKRSMVHDGDILLTLTGTKYKRDYGYAVCIEGEHELLVNQRILCLSPTEKIDKEYLLYYLRSEIFRDIFFSNETGGVNQGNVSSKFVENIEIKLPSIEEQKEISKILKNILTKEEQAKELAEFVIEQIELMKKSILAKAFRGELGTNIATEESAIEILKSIL